MPDVRETLLATISGANVSVNDLTHLVDVSDPTMDPTGTAKKITVADLTLALSLNVTATKTATYTAAPFEIVRANTSGGAFTVTLPSAPDNRTVCGVILETAGNTLTLARGGTDTFNGGGTSKDLVNAGDVWLGVYASGVWLSLIDAGLSLNDGTYVVTDTGTPGVVKLQLTDEIGVSSVKLLGGGQKVVSADYMTTAVLPSCTYSNGTLGVGATLTANPTYATLVVDTMTTVAGDKVWVSQQAVPFQNGLYTVTQPGDASNPFILTRDLLADQAADWANSVIVSVANGLEHAGSMIRVDGGTFVMGTTGINASPLVTPGDLAFGVNRDRYIVVEDFDKWTAPVTALTTTPQHMPGATGYVTGTGTGAQVTQKDLTVTGGELVPGCASLETGTTSSGQTAVGFTSGSTFWDVLKKWKAYFRVKIPTLSDGTQTHNIRLGWMDTTNGAPTNGIYFEARSGTTNWLAVSRAAGTNTEVDTGQAANTAFKGLQIFVPGDGNIYFYNAGTVSQVLIATISTGIMAAATAITPVCSILKSAGLLTRELRLDVVSFDQPAQRAGIWVP